MRKPKEKKPRKCCYRIIEPQYSPEMYALLDRARGWHETTRDAKIMLAWKTGIKADKDGLLMLGKCVKVSPLYRELEEQLDFIIVLNQEAWSVLKDIQRLALLDHELCHAAEALDKDFEPVEDELGRKVFRTRKHDIEEFREVVQRHGCYKADLLMFAEAILKLQPQAPLFDEEAPQKGATLQ